MTRCWRHRLNQYTSAGPATFAYDANGNLTSDGSVSMVYDAENRLVLRLCAKTASLGYDPLGRLFQTSGGSAGVTQFLYDPGSKPGAGADELVAEYNSSGALLRRYVHGLGTDDPILWYEGAGLADRRSLQADHQGSIIGVANGAGASIAINAYDEWGVPNAGNQGRFQYTGQAWLPELGMYHYKARIYSPTLGRFLQTDPVGYEDQVNLYAYVGNDPVNLVDPTGMTSACPADTICVTAPRSPPPQLPTWNLSNLGVIARASAVAAASRALSVAALFQASCAGPAALCNESGEEELEDTPETEPDKFKPVRGKKAKEHEETGEIYVKDQLHKDHYEVYRNRKDFERGRRDRDVWSDGRPKRRF